MEPTAILPYVVPPHSISCPDRSNPLCVLLEFEINEEVQDMLRELQGPIGVISVAGMYRTGKSYLLNRMLLNRSGGFGVGPTINPCTKVRISE